MCIPCTLPLDLPLREGNILCGQGGGLLVKTKTTPAGLGDLAGLEKRISVQVLCHSSTEHYH